MLRHSSTGFALWLVFTAGMAPAMAQERLPIIDMHMHASPIDAADRRFEPPFCAAGK